MDLERLKKVYEELGSILAGDCEEESSTEDNDLDDTSPGDGGQDFNAIMPNSSGDKKKASVSMMGAMLKSAMKK